MVCCDIVLLAMSCAVHLFSRWVKLNQVKFLQNNDWWITGKALICLAFVLFHLIYIQTPCEIHLDWNKNYGEFVFIEDTSNKLEFRDLIFYLLRWTLLRKILLIHWDLPTFISLYFVNGRRKNNKKVYLIFWKQSQKNKKEKNIRFNLLGFCWSGLPIVSGWFTRF